MKRKRKKKTEEWNFNAYSERNATLRKMGFPSYKAYLASDLWRQVRAKVFRRKGRICSLCPCPATAVHHNRYHRNDLLGKGLKYLNPICDKCHDQIEFSRKGRKKPLEKAANHFADLRRQKMESAIQSIFLDSDYMGEIA